MNKTILINYRKFYLKLILIVIETIKLQFKIKRQ